MNPAFSQPDVVIVTGANDIVNPKANTDDSGPIAEMLVLNVSDAYTVIVNKRSLSTSFYGIPNPLFAETTQACYSATLKAPAGTGQPVQRDNVVIGWVLDILNSRRAPLLELDCDDSSPRVNSAV